MNPESAIGSVMQSVMRRWLEVLLPVYSVALVVVWLHAEYTPTILTESITASPLPGMAWAVVGALTGILGLWAVIVSFFLLYSPFYLIGKLPLLVGQAGWVDRREVRFYLACFALLCGLVALLCWQLSAGVTVFALASGCGPVFWRFLV